MVGIVITENLRWEENTNYLCEKARRKLWILRRMKGLNLNDAQMFDVYTKEVRSILELNVPVWHPGLSKKQSTRIERIQKIALKIILGNNYVSYSTALQKMGAKRLQERRLDLCRKFAEKNLKSEHPLFELKHKVIQTRSKDLVKEFRCNTSRFQKSSLPFLSKMLNAN